MSELVVHKTAVAQWHALIGEAEHQCQHYLSESSESYLVFLLMSVIHSPDIVHGVVGLDFLQSQQQWGQQRVHQLRDVGDKCLLLAGLFPGCAQQRHVQVDYFVKIGRSAYQNLSNETSHDSLLFAGLAADFIEMQEVLYTTRTVRDSALMVDFKDLARYLQ